MRKIIEFLFGKKSLVSERERYLIGTTGYYTLWTWWNKLNNWDWPQEVLPEEVPKEHQKGRRITLMDLIEAKVGKKYLLREHNRDMTEQEFEDFWQGTKCGDQEAYRRYYEDLTQRISRNLPTVP